LVVHPSGVEPETC